MFNLKTIAKKAVKAFLAAITSPEAVKAEKNFAVFVATRVLLAIGASAALVEIVAKAIGSL